MMKPTKCPERHRNWIFFLGRINNLFWRGLESNIDPGSLHNLQAASVGAVQRAGDISSHPLEALTAAAIIFRVHIYSGPIFEKPSVLRKKYPPLLLLLILLLFFFTCDRVNSGNLAEGLHNLSYPPVRTRTGVSSALLFDFICGYLSSRQSWMRLRRDFHYRAPLCLWEGAGFKRGC